MDGRTLKQRLQAFMGAQYSLTDIARQLGINPQNLQTWFAAADVKSGTIEKFADVLGIPPTAFYDGTGITAVNNSVALQGDGNDINTTDGALVSIIERQSKQITDLINIISKQNG